MEPKVSCPFAVVCGYRKLCGAVAKLLKALQPGVAAQIALPDSLPAGFCSTTFVNLRPPEPAEPPLRITWPGRSCSTERLEFLEEGTADRGTETFCGKGSRGVESDGA